MKTKTYRNPDLLAVVRHLPCVHCGRMGVHAAHSDMMRHGKGKGLKASDAAIMALCPEEHHEHGNGKNYDRDTREYLTFRYIAATYESLASAGFIDGLEYTAANDCENRAQFYIRQMEQGAVNVRRV